MNSKNCNRNAKKFTVNPKYIQSTVVSLADEDIDFRLNLARKSRDIRTLRRLAHDDDAFVQQAVANNPNTPGVILEELLQANPKLSRDIASNPNTPENILEELAESSDKYVRYYVVCNPSAPSSALAILSNDKELYIRLGVVEHPNITAELAEKLLDDEIPKVRASALRALDTLTY